MEKWQLLESNTVLETPWLSVHKNKYQVNKSNTIDDYYIIKRSDFVLVIALRDDSLVLVRQYRPATDKFYLALPAGFLQPGEEPELCARRELLEETGYSATECKIIGELHPLPGYIQSRAYIAHCELAPGRSGEFDQQEISDVVEIELSTVMKMIVKGEINEMQAVSAILIAREILF